MKTMIIYASRYGGAKKCAEHLSERLKGEVMLHDVSNQLQVDLNGVDRIIIGGSIYMGKIQKDIKKFCESNQSSLLNKQLGLFISCMQSGDFAMQELQDAFSNALWQHATAKDYFGGQLIYKKLSFFHKMVTKMVSKADQSNFPALDENNNVDTLSYKKMEAFVKKLEGDSHAK